MEFFVIFLKDLVFLLKYLAFHIKKSVLIENLSFQSKNMLFQITFFEILGFMRNKFEILVF